MNILKILTLKVNSFYVRILKKMQKLTRMKLKRDELFPAIERDKPIWNERDEKA